MNYEELHEWTIKAADWAREYHQGLRSRPVRPNVQPGEIAKQIPDTPPSTPESINEVFEDFKRLIPDAMTHWQHPRFLAYFSSNAAPASILAEHLANTISSQCMLWQTSPAATELETVMVDWLRQAVGLPDSFTGVIQDTATSTTLAAVLTMRERALDFKGNQTGLSGSQPLRVYASDQVHSSIDQAVRLAGIGQENLVKVPTKNDFSMCPDQLEKHILADLANRLKPCGLVGCIGGTSIGASDNLNEILPLALKYDLYTHVDAAWAGSAMICPEFRDTWQGIEQADSIVFNPHKWLGANFDCSIQFLKDPSSQIKTVSIKPSYLRTLEQNQITNYSEWCIPLGRRFRALKIWFLLRIYGLEGLQSRIRNHISWANEAAETMANWPDFEIVTPPKFSLFTFRFKPPGTNPDHSTQALLEKVNQDGRTYLTQTTHDGKFVIRLTIGQFETQRSDVVDALAAIKELAENLDVVESPDHV